MIKTGNHNGTELCPCPKIVFIVLENSNVAKVKVELLQITDYGDDVATVP
ncbi:MAG: hypothetical protein AAFN50_11890 [Pseudomonadota bacterium]